MKYSLTHSFVLLVIVFFSLSACSKKPVEKVQPTANPVISSLNTNEGNTGDAIIIAGTGFGAAVNDNQVLFNGTTANITAASSTQLTVTVPQGASTGYITVKTGGITANGPVFVCLGTLAINNISASSGPYMTVVQISGTGFSPTIAHNHVFFNGKPATISAATNVQVTAAVPLAAGTGNISVSANNNQPIQGPLFTYEKAYIVTTFAGSTAAGIKNGSGTNAIFNSPTGMCSDAAGNLYITEAVNHLVRKITSDGTVSSFVGTATDAVNNGTLTTHYLSFPQAVTFSSSGDLYVADALTNVIEKITPGGAVSTVAGTLNVIGSADGPGLSASFNGPHGMCFDPSGNLYIADTFNNLIRKVDPSGNVTTFAGNKQPGHVNGIGTSASLSGPSGIVSDAAGNLYVSDSNNGRIRKITPSGVVSDWGEAAFAYPDGITIDASGNLYVADSTGILIKKIDANGNVTTIAGSISIHIQNEGLGTAVGFYDPAGISLDKSGNLYVTDGNEIRKIVFE